MQTALTDAAETSFGDSHFTVVARDKAQAVPRHRWAQQPSDSHASDSVCAAEAGQAGIAVAHRGLHEYQLIDIDDDHAAGIGTGSALQVTLLRCVEWLSRDDIVGRIGHEGQPGGHAGPGLHTPGAQCPGDHAFRYALLPYTGSWHAAGIPGLARRWSAPPLIIEPDPGTMQAEPGYRARRTEIAARRGGPFDIERLGAGGPSITGAELAALLTAPDGSGDIIMRLYNPHPDEREVRLVAPDSWGAAHPVMLDGTTPDADGTLTGTGGQLGASRIATLRFTPDHAVRGQ